LMARLDRLGPAKEVAQVGAAIGREFSHTLLAAVVSKPEAELNSALDRLIVAGLLFRQGAPIVPDPQSLERSPYDHFRGDSLALNGRTGAYAVVSIIFGQGLRWDRPIR
jgi:predicted ATPase